MPLMMVGVVGKERRTLIDWSMVKPEKAAPVTGTTVLYLEDYLLALWRRTLGSECNRYAIAWPGELGAGPMAVGGMINGRRRGNREECRE